MHCRDTLHDSKRCDLYIFSLFLGAAPVGEDLGTGDLHSGEPPLCNVFYEIKNQLMNFPWQGLRKIEN